MPWAATNSCPGSADRLSAGERRLGRKLRRDPCSTTHQNITRMRKGSVKLLDRATRPVFDNPTHGRTGRPNSAALPARRFPPARSRSAALFVTRNEARHFAMFDQSACSAHRRSTAFRRVPFRSINGQGGGEQAAEESPNRFTAAKDQMRLGVIHTPEGGESGKPQEKKCRLFRLPRTPRALEHGATKVHVTHANSRPARLVRALLPPRARPACRVLSTHRCDFDERPVPCANRPRFN